MHRWLRYVVWSTGGTGHGKTITDAWGVAKICIQRGSAPSLVEFWDEFLKDHDVVKPRAIRKRERGEDRSYGISKESVGGRTVVRGGTVSTPQQFEHWVQSMVDMGFAEDKRGAEA